MKYFLFIIVFVAISDWSQASLFIEKLINPSIQKTKLKDKKILKVIKEKSGLNLKHITVIESDRMYGGMSGIPGKPIMYLSSSVLKNLNKDELGYVLLHEAAHSKYYHPSIVAILQIILILMGIYILQFTDSVTFSFIIGILFTFTFIKIARATERAAENFAASRMDNPKAMVTAVDKFEKAQSKESLLKLRKFVSWNISYSEKRHIALKSIS